MDKNMVEKYARELSSLCRTVKTGEPMSRHTSFKIGGSADIMAVAENESQLLAVLKYVRENSLPLLFLGNGSNMLVSDKGIRGVVLKLGGDFLDISCDAEKGTVTAGAGAMLSALCGAALEHSLSGLEFAWGIPGSVGGAVYMNAGAYGGELKDVALSVDYITLDGEKGTYTADQCGFGYRESVFQSGDRCVTSLTVQLEPGDREEIKAKMDDIFERRRSKQPLEYPSAGSVFKRPVGFYAGTLIEQCGLKGRRVGGAQVSRKHAGFIINRGGATCSDVLELVKNIQSTVDSQTGVRLECEIRVYGEQ